LSPFWGLRGNIRWSS